MAEDRLEPTAERARPRELRCVDPRCATVLPDDVELCDECGGSQLRLMDGTDAVLIGRNGRRRVAFAVGFESTSVIGRSTPGEIAPDIDLGRMANGSTVHRRHALIEHAGGTWYLTHEGRNPLVVQRARETQVVRQGQTTVLLPGDDVIVGKVLLQFQAPQHV